MTWKYLHRINGVCSVLDHRLTPEVRAMFAAMASRMPDGGIEARYKQIVEAVAEDMFVKDHEDLFQRAGVSTFEEALQSDWDILADVEDESPLLLRHHVAGTIFDWAEPAEEALTTRPLHPVIQGFFDKFVGAYGHSSILELTGSPAVYVEGTSWFCQWLLFDSPLCAGQERSTRAIRSKNWPMATEATGYPELEDLHTVWLNVFEHEVEAWKVELRLPCGRCEGKFGVDHCADCEGTGRKYAFMKDPQAFRPALDRARWAIPGTIATGSCHAANLRIMARAVRDGKLLADKGGNKVTASVWKSIEEGYAAAVPGLAGLGLKEAVYDAGESRIPGHLTQLARYPGGDEVMLILDRPSGSAFWDGLDAAYTAQNNKTYLDPIFNHAGRATFRVMPSLAAARDWHRHRTFYPWQMGLYWPKEKDTISIHPGYQVLSDYGKEWVPKLLKQSTEVYSDLVSRGDLYGAMMALPFGTQMVMTGQAGLQHAVYALSLRANAVGANFEYEAQATEALKQLRSQLDVQFGPELRKKLGPVT